MPEFGWWGVQAQFWDLPFHALVIMHFVLLIKLAEPDGRKNVQGVLGISCILSHIIRYNRTQKAKFTIIKIVLAEFLLITFLAFVTVSLQTGKDSGRVP